MPRDLVVSDWSWVVIMCAPHAAFDVEESLVGAGAAPLLIRKREWVKRRYGGVRKREIKESSLFGRYVPVGVKCSSEWGWLRGVRDVGGVLKVEDRALVVPVRVIEGLGGSGGHWGMGLDA